MIITVGGLVGSGKSTLAKMLAQKYRLKYVSIGQILRDMAKERGITLVEMSHIAETDPDIDREIDRKQAETARGDCVIDSRLGAFLLKPDFRIWLTVSLETRARRVASRDGIEFDEAMKRVRAREASERKRYKGIYGYDLDDLSVYDLVLNTDLFGIQEMADVCYAAIDALKH